MLDWPSACIKFVVNEALAGCYWSRERLSLAGSLYEISIDAEKIPSYDMDCKQL
jgi:hypothetical protein